MMFLETNDVLLNDATVGTVDTTWKRFSSTFTINEVPVSTSVCVRVGLLAGTAGTNVDLPNGMELSYTGIQFEPGPVAYHHLSAAQSAPSLHCVRGIMRK